MSKKLRQLSRREREIMDILFELREASAQEVRARLTDAPSNSATRALLTRLEEKGVVNHIERDLRYVYIPTIPHEEARESALSRVVRVFYNGSLASAVTGLVRSSGDNLTTEELEQLEETIRLTRQRRRQ